MSHLFLLTILCFSTFAAFAQSEDKIVTQVTSTQRDSVMTVTLPEIIVKAKERIETADKVILMPTASLRKHATNALDLTGLMGIAGLVVSPQEKSVVTHTGAEVVLCINGVVARAQDVAMLQAQDVVKMEYLRAPSGKWAGKAAVLNYIVRNSGGNVYLSADGGFIYQRGEYVAALDYTRGKTKLRLAAMSKWDRDHSYVEESGLYTFTNGYQLTRYYNPDHALTRHHSEDVRFELTNKGDTHRFNLTLGLDASTIMQVYMDQPPRDLAIDDEIKNIESLIDAEKYSDARTALEKMQERPGSDANPELSKIEATLSFYED